MPAKKPSVRLVYLVACAVSLALLTYLWYGLGRAVNLPDVASASHKMQCASYSPFGKDQSPFQQPLQIHREQMETDLALLAKQFTCVRSYSVTGLEALPEIAREHGLTLMIGAWVSRSHDDTQVEINNAIRMANANPDVVKAVIVGNEALLRKEVTPRQLVKLIEQVKAKVKQPVTYADVWEFWLKHPEVAPAVDFITIHLLPYWEDNPAGIDTALSKVAKVHDRFAKQFAPKEIFIGETGWPSEGRQRETAVPSRLNQALFMRGFVAMAEENGWHYNLIEAFDQPWKRASEGAVGGYWGLYDADRNDKAILQGDVSNVPDWPVWLAVSGALALIALWLGGTVTSRRNALLLPALASIAGGSIALWAQLSWLTSRYWGEWLWAFALLLLNLLVMAHAALALSNQHGWRQRWFQWLQRRAHYWLLGAGFAGAVMMLALVVDARYRSFPSSALLLPTLFYALRPVRMPVSECRLLALIVTLGIAPQLYIETLGNQQAIGWALVSALLACALWRSSRPLPG